MTPRRPARGLVSISLHDLPWPAALVERRTLLELGGGVRRFDLAPSARSAGEAVAMSAEIERLLDRSALVGARRG